MLPAGRRGTRGQRRELRPTRWLLHPHWVGIGCAETAETAAVAQLAPDHLRGSAFGFLAAIQAVGNLAASAIAGVLWTAISPTAAFIYVASWLLLAIAGLLLTALAGRATAA